jgi:hypothetical protein
MKAWLKKGINARDINVILYMTRKSQGSTALRDFPSIIANPEPRQGSLPGTLNHDRTEGG